MNKIKIAIAGVGNCASALIQGIHYYAQPGKKAHAGLMHPIIGDYGPSDIAVAAAFDIDARKVGKDVSEAIFAPPNCTRDFFRDIPKTQVRVLMGRLLDGISEHMVAAPAERGFRPASIREPDMEEVVRVLRETGTDLLLNYLPVGAVAATQFYAECALAAGVGFINNIPVFIASDPKWAKRFAEKRLPVIGDDIKSQLGATIVHRVLADLFGQRGATIRRTYQLNTGGNTDFLNMLNRDRLQFKKVSKTEAVQAALGERLPDENIHIGPCDYVPWQKDNKVCYIRMEGAVFGDVPLDLELRLSVEDSPNSAGVAIDAIRCCRLALDRGIGGAIASASAFLMKHPPVQWTDTDARHAIDAFISGTRKD